MVGASRPLKMLPPPTTTAGWTPTSITSASWRARRSTDPSWMPKSPPGGANASPDSLSSTRPYASPPAEALMRLPPRGGAVLSPNVAREPPDLHLLPDLGRELPDHVLDRPLALGILEELLVEEAAVLVESLQLALDDPREDVLGLPLLAGLCLVDLALLRQDLLGHLVARHPPRVGRGYLHGQVAGQGPELGRVRHEVRLAVHLDQDAQLPLHVDVGLHDSFARDLPGSLLGVRKTLGAQELLREL